MILGSGLLQSGFNGAYDAIASIAAAYSTRRLRRGYTGPLLRLVADRTGYPEQDIGYTTTGDLDTAAAASFLAGDTGYVTKWYDQSGNADDAAQATLANMPLYVASGQNGHPTLRFSGDYMDASGVSVTQPDTIVAVGKPTVSISVNIVDGVSARQTVFHTATVPNFFAGTVQAGSGGNWLNQWAVAIAVFNGASSLFRFDGSTISTANPGTNALTGLRIGTFTAAAGQWQGDIAEVIVVGAAWDETQSGVAEAIVNAYWSVY